MVHDLDWSEPSLRQISLPVLRCLTYMQTVEYHTPWYLREALSASMLTKPAVTDFLVGWAFEETWHGLLLQALLELNGHQTPDTEMMRKALAGSVRRSQAFFAIANCLRIDLLPVHMAVGAMNEWTAQYAYWSLSKQCESTTARTVLRRIAAQEGRHAAFYRSEAYAALQASARQRQFVRSCMSYLWRPVGTKLYEENEVAWVSWFLFGDREGLRAARRIDSRLRALPGLEDVRPFENYLSKTR